MNIPATKTRPPVAKQSGQCAPARMASVQCPSSRTSQSGEGTLNEFCASSNLHQEGSHVKLVQSSRMYYLNICALLRTKV